MPDQPSNNDPKKSRKSPGPLDAKLLAQLEKDQQIIKAAADELGQDAELASAMASHFLDAGQTVPITPANLKALDKQADTVRAAGSAVVAGKADFHDVTDAEDADTETARAAVRRVQVAAKEKYEETNPAKLQSYYIGQPLRSRKDLTQAGAAIYTLLRTTDDENNPVTPQDTLPGYNAAKLTQLKADLGQYGAIQTEQSAAQKKAGVSRVEFSSQCEQITRRRRRLQLALDGERPHSPTNAPLRKRLGLPPDKAMS